VSGNCLQGSGFAPGSLTEIYAGSAPLPFLVPPVHGVQSRYTKLPVDCALSPCSLEEAALQVGPAFCYYLHVHAKMVWRASEIVRDPVINTQRVLQPQISVILDAGINSETEWFLVANGRACGSPGV
jgi:hypothetical protein